MRRLVALFFACLVATSALAVEPGEILNDPALEARARAISAGLRCLVCQNQSIDDSAAPLAHDLRVLVRERLVAGDSDDEIRAYLVSRYGEFILLRPAFAWHNWLLWAAPAIGLAAGLALVVVAFRRRKSRPPLPEALSEEEDRRLQAILEDGAKR